MIIDVNKYSGAGFNIYNGEVSLVEIKKGGDGNKREVWATVQVSETKTVKLPKGAPLGKSKAEIRKNIAIIAEAVADLDIPDTSGETPFD